MKSVFRYLNRTGDLRNMSGTENGIPDRVINYSDSDCAGRKLDRKATSGYVFKIAEGSISWESKKQMVVAASTAETE